MLKSFIKIVKQVITNRLFVLLVVIMGMFYLLINRLFTLQIIEGAEHLQDFTYRISKERNLKSTRGNIYDRYGRLLAGNELAYAVSIDESLDIADKDTVIFRLINIIEKNGDTVINNFPIVLDDNGKFTFTGSDNQILNFKKDIFSRAINRLTDEQKAMNAEDTYLYIRDKLFKIDLMYSEEETLKIMNLRFTLFMKRYAKYQSEIIAINIGEKTLADIKENSIQLPGVNIVQDALRIYPDGEYMAHIIGYTGPITTAQMDSLNEEIVLMDDGNVYNNYTANEIVGKIGIEKELEILLRGKDGAEKVMVNNLGNILDITERIEPVPGKDIYLTIDKDLQVEGYQLLEKRIAEILASKITTTAPYVNKDKLIGLDEVFIAMLDNNLLDISKMPNEQSSDLYTSIHQRYIDHLNTQLAEVEKQLVTAPKAMNALNNETKEYLNYVYRYLINEKILDISVLDKKDETYVAWSNEQGNLKAFLTFAISNNAIDLNKLNIDNDYYSLDEIYEVMYTQILNNLSNDTGFMKRIGKYLVLNKRVTYKEWCLLLYDQGVLIDAGDEVVRLSQNRISILDFIRSKIIGLEIKPSELALDPCSGSAVITDVNTGEVLALISYPSYDNNRLVNNVDSAYFVKLLNDASLPMYNRATQQRTAPGSTFKMISSIAGLTENVVKPYETIVDKGIFDKIPSSPRCHAYISGYTHGSVNLVKALEVSCNYYYYEIAYKMSMTDTNRFKSDIGTETLTKYASMFGLDSKSGLELPEASPQISDVDAVISAIGQGSNNFAPIHMARYATALANGGTLFDLNLVNRVNNADGSLYYEKTPTIRLENDFNPEYIDLVKQGMYSVTYGNNGSARSIFKDFPVTVVGKTGTAQEDTSRPSHALFLGYAPYENPEIAVFATIPFGYAASNAAIVVKDLVGSYYDLDAEVDNFNYDNTLR